MFVSSAVIMVPSRRLADMALSPFQVHWLMNAELRGPSWRGRSPCLGATVVGSAPAHRGPVTASFGEGLVLPDGLSVHEQRLPTDKRVRAVSIWSGATAVASGVAPAVARVACG